MQFGTLKSYGGKMNLFVQPSNGFSVLADETELSIARIEVVPTAQIRFLFDFGIIHDIASILCDDQLLRIHFVF
jgi:hypothetical protein